MNTKKVALFSALLAFAFSFFSCTQKEKGNIANPIKFKTYTLQKDFKGDSILPSIFISLKMEYPTDYPNKSILERIQLSVVQSVLGEKATNSPESEMEKMVENIITEHKTRITELQNNPQLEDGDCLSNSYQETTQSVVFNQDGIISILTADSSHYGGSHGIKFLYYNNFDLQTGNDLKYNDLFIEDSEDMLSSFIIQKLMADNHLEEDRQLEEIGFLDLGEIKPVNNFCIDKEGITFVYNPSEIACLTLGAIKVFLSYDELTLLLKEESPITKIVD